MHNINQGTLLTAHPLPITPFPGLSCSNGRRSVRPSASNGNSASAVTLAAVAAASAGLPSTMKDSRWLTLEVCRQFQRKMCSRDENECKFAHPPLQVDVQNGRVICCYDSIKGKCQRRDPPCKYFHPPQHLREQLIQNGRNNLVMKSMQLQFLQQHFLSQGGILPLSSATASNSTQHNVGQCTSPGSPTSLGGSMSSNIYPTTSRLNLANPGMVTAYSLLGIQLTPYLNAIAASPMVAAAFNSVKACPAALSNGNLAQISLGVIPNLGPMALQQTPAKRPALTDVKSGLPMFQSDQTCLVTSPSSSMNLPPANLYTFHTQANTVSPNMTPQTDLSHMGIAIENNGNSSNGIPVQSIVNLGDRVTEDEFHQQGQFYPETYVEIPQFNFQ